MAGRYRGMQKLPATYPGNGTQIGRHRCRRSFPTPRPQARKAQTSPPRITRARRPKVRYHPTKLHPRPKHGPASPLHLPFSRTGTASHGAGPGGRRRADGPSSKRKRAGSAARLSTPLLARGFPPVRPSAWCLFRRGCEACRRALARLGDSGGI